QTNQTIVISPDHTVIGTSLSTDNTDLFFNWIQQEEIGLTFEHREDAYSDFDRLKLLPYSQSDRGPATAVGDINNDGMQDVYFGGSKYIPSQVFLQSPEGFVKMSIPQFRKDSV